MYVNRDGQRHGFEHQSSGEEKDKLFIRNVPTDFSEAQANALFQVLPSLSALGWIETQAACRACEA